MTVSEIGQSAGIVVDRAVEIRRHRVHGEIPPRCVFRPVLGIGNHRMPPVGLDVAAQGGDLKRAVFGDRRHRSVIESGRDHMNIARLKQRHDVAGRRIGRDIQIHDFASEKSIANAPADESDRGPVGTQRVEQHARIVGLHPVGE